jgi:hypothetical protein
MPQTTQLESANQPQVAASSYSIPVGDILEYGLIPGNASKMTIETGDVECRGMRLLPTNPYYIKSVRKRGHKYTFVFTGNARQKRIPIYFTKEEEN